MHLKLSSAKVAAILSSGRSVKVTALFHDEPGGHFVVCVAPSHSFCFYEDMKQIYCSNKTKWNNVF